MHRFFLILLLLSASLYAQPRVAVSIAPQKYLVERIAEDRLLVDVIVPDGASPHSYEPTPKQTVTLQKSSVWFRIGEGFEQRLVGVLAPKMIIVDQREGIDLLPASGCCCSNKDAHDSHIWLSPTLLKSQAKQITTVLCQRFPESAAFFQNNFKSLSLELDQLNDEISEMLEGRKGTTMLVSHPAFGYFCREYDLKQISIENEGKEPTTKQLLALIEEARDAEIGAVFLQRQYNVKGGERVAHALNAKVVMVDPYREDVIANLKFLAEVL